MEPEEKDLHEHTPTPGELPYTSAQVFSSPPLGASTSGLVLTPQRQDGTSHSLLFDFIDDCLANDVPEEKIADMTHALAMAMQSAVSTHESLQYLYQSMREANSSYGPPGFKTPASAATGSKSTPLDRRSPSALHRNPYNWRSSLRPGALCSRHSTAPQPPSRWGDREDSCSSSPIIWKREATRSSSLDDEAAPAASTPVLYYNKAIQRASRDQPQPAARHRSEWKRTLKEVSSSLRSTIPTTNNTSLELFLLQSQQKMKEVERMRLRRKQLESLNSTDEFSMSDDEVDETLSEETDEKD